jgi:hypothetical protein
MAPGKPCPVASIAGAKLAFGSASLRPSNSKPVLLAKSIYRLQKRMERLINRLKQNRRIATRDEKGEKIYWAMWLTAVTLLWL